MKKFLEDCPGRCGEIARLIDQSLPESLPAISLAAAISFCAALRCGRVVSPDGFEPNVYACIIAESGLGKGQAQSALREIAKQVELDLEIGEPASDSGLLKALVEKPRALLVWDEFGIAIEKLSKSQNSYLATILKEVMKLFSMAGHRYIGRQYSERGRTDIYAPYLNIFAASTPVRFFDALDNKFVLDGFLSRWLTFEQPNNAEGKQQTRKPIDVSEELKAWIRKIEEWEPAPGNLGQILQVQKYVCEVSAPELHRLRAAECDKRTRRAGTDFERAFRRRSFEQYSKLCLALSDGLMLDVTERGEEVGFFAYELSEHLIDHQIELCHSQLKHDTRSARERLRESIGLAWVSARDLWIKTRTLNLSPTDRRQAVEELLQNDIWEKSLLATPGKRQKTTHYRRVG